MDTSRTKNKVRFGFEKENLMGQETLEAGNRYDAASSGITNKLTSQPQANSRKVRSCHKATNENTKTVFSTRFLEPPNGT